MNRFLLLGLALLLSVSSPACAAGKGRVKPDPITASTALDGDATGIVEGCGNQPVVGFTYCRFQEGASVAQAALYFIGPPSKCDGEACVYIKVWDNTAQLVWGGSIPKGKTRVGVTWLALLNETNFQVNARGTWTWNVEVHWKDLDGRENVSKATGDIVLRVFRTSYVPLQDVSSDPAFVWSWVEGGYRYKMTSGLRAYVDKVQ